MLNPEHEFWKTAGRDPNIEIFLQRPDINSALLTEKQDAGIPVFGAVFSVYKRSDDLYCMTASVLPGDRYGVMIYLRLIAEEIELTPELLNSGIKDYSGVRTIFEDECMVSEQPIMVVGFGEWEGIGEPVAALFFIPGIAPETAMEECKLLAAFLSVGISERN